MEEDEGIKILRERRQYMRVLYTCPGCIEIPNPRKALFRDNKMICSDCLPIMKGEEEAKEYKRDPIQEMFIEVLLEIEQYFTENGIPFAEDVEGFRLGFNILDCTVEHVACTNPSAKKILYLTIANHSEPRDQWRDECWESMTPTTRGCNAVVASFQ